MESVSEEHPVGERSASAEQRFTELAHAVGPALRRYVVRRVPEAAVDDVLADVFLVLWRRLRDVPADEPLPWCYAVARHCVANQRRAARRQSGLVERIAAHRTVTVLPDDDPDHAELHEALAGLADLDREVLQLWAWEGLAPREIATVTGLTANAVSIRLHRLRRRLAADLGAEPTRGRGKNARPAGQEPGEGRRSR